MPPGPAPLAQRETIFFRGNPYKNVGAGRDAAIAFLKTAKYSFLARLEFKTGYRYSQKVYFYQTFAMRKYLIFG